MGKKDTQHIETELSRDLGFTSALAIGIGTMIAAGIFSLSGLAIQSVGSAAILSFLLAAIVATFTALTYCEFVSIYPRSGEGYLYARKTFPAPLAYFVGWALFLGYASSCAFYIATFSEYFNEFIWHSPLEALSGIVMLIGLTMLNIKGTEESGKFQVVVTAAKVVLLIWFISGGLKYVDMEEVINKFSTDVSAIGATAAMVFITFFGFSAIAASAGEIQNPVKNIPRAIFVSMGLVTVLYTFVILVMLFAGLSEYTEAAMGEAAKKFLGGVGGYVIIFGALFSMVSAANASIMAGSRVTLSMSKLGHLPKEIGVINATTRTPIIAVLIMGLTIAIFSTSLSLKALAHFADTVLLTALVLVNYALIVHRKKYPNKKRPFKVPLVPVLPFIGIIANTGLIFQIGYQDPLSVALGVGALLLGMVGFSIWKGVQPEAEAIPGTKSRVALGRFASREDEKKFRILVPLSSTVASVKRMMKIAIALAKEKEGEIVVLRVAVVPDQLPLRKEKKYIQRERAILDLAAGIVEKANVPVSSTIRIGRSVAKAILECEKDWHCNLVLLQWKGYSTSTQKILGRVTDAIVTHARADIFLIKFAEDLPIRNILLPTAGGEHARCAEMYAATLVNHLKGRLTVCRVQGVNEKEQDDTALEKRLDKAKERIQKVNGFKARSKIVYNDSVDGGIIEASQDYDTIMVGATRDSIYQQILFGSIPEKLATQVDKNVIVIKHYDPLKALLGRVVGEAVESE
ncbi:MAG: amino acid permease [Bacteroidota bacterium]